MRADGILCLVPPDREGFRRLGESKLTMPVLAIGGDKSLGEFLGRQMKLAASNVTTVVVEDSGHWLLEEQPDQTTSALVAFSRPLRTALNSPPCYHEHSTMPDPRPAVAYFRSGHQ